MSLSCAEFKALVWGSLDAKAALPPEAAVHSAACPACAAYAREAETLDRLLPAAFETPAVTVEPGVLDRIRKERDRAELPGYWVPACVFASLAAVAALWYEGLWSLVSPYVTVDLPRLGSVLRWGDSLASRVAPLQLSALAWTCGLAALLWLSAHRRLLKEERP
jgi:hypothetical protein